jgi:hypothetical protein
MRASPTCTEMNGPFARKARQPAVETRKHLLSGHLEPRAWRLYSRGPNETPCRSGSRLDPRRYAVPPHPTRSPSAEPQPRHNRGRMLGMRTRMGAPTEGLGRACGRPLVSVSINYYRWSAPISQAAVPICSELFAPLSFTLFWVWGAPPFDVVMCRLCFRCALTGDCAGFCAVTPPQTACRNTAPVIVYAGAPHAHSPHAAPQRRARGSNRGRDNVHGGRSRVGRL